MITPDYVNKARDNQPKSLTREYFKTLLNDMNVRFICDEIRQHKPNAENQKILLPAVTWQAHFDGKLRTDANARPTGLFCLDVDIHHEDMFKLLCKDKNPDEAYAWAGQEARQRAWEWAETAKTDETLGIVGIHVSPSGTGVHVIACCHHTCKSIEENQARLARLLNTSYDAVCKDWARIFFVTPKEDWTYIDYDSIFGEETPSNSPIKGEEGVIQKSK